MIIGLIDDKVDQLLEFKKGDILCFTNGYDWDYHLVAYNVEADKYCLVSLEDSIINDEWDNLDEMIDDLNKINNRFKLVDVLDQNEVVLCGVNNV